MQQDRESSEEEEYAFLGELSTGTFTERTVTVTVNCTPVNLKLDTGVAVSTIPEWKGCFQCILSAKGHSSIQDIYVVNKLKKSLLGLPAIEALNFIHQIETVTQQKLH